MNGQAMQKSKSHGTESYGKARSFQVAAVEQHQVIEDDWAAITQVGVLKSRQIPPR